jgi:hypothetical protein
VLSLPAQIGGLHNNAGTVTPYDPGKVVGDTSPNLPQPVAQDGGCGGLAMIIVIVVAVVATIVTAGAAAMALAEAGTYSGVWAAGTAALSGGAGVGVGIVAGAAGAAAGSVASQLTGMALGVQKDFSWKQVGMSAIGGAVSGGIAGYANQAAQAGTLIKTSAFVRAAVSNAISQGVNMMVGNQHRFDWRGVASAAAGAETGDRLGGALGMQDAATRSQLDFGQVLFRSSMTGFAAGTAAMIAGGGRTTVQQVMSDAFGNALGEALAAKATEALTQSRIDDLHAELGFDPKTGATSRSTIQAMVRAGASDADLRSFFSTDGAVASLQQLDNASGQDTHGPVQRLMKQSLASRVTPVDVAAAAEDPAIDPNVFQLEKVTVTGKDPDRALLSNIYDGASGFFNAIGRFSNNGQNMPSWLTAAFGNTLRSGPLADLLGSVRDVARSQLQSVADQVDQTTRDAFITTGVVSGMFQGVGNSLISLGSMANTLLGAQKYVLFGMDNAVNRAVPGFDDRQGAFNDVLGMASGLATVMREPGRYLGDAIGHRVDGVTSALDAAQSSNRLSDWFLYGVQMGNVTFDVMSVVAGAAGAAQLATRGVAGLGGMLRARIDALAPDVRMNPFIDEPSVGRKVPRSSAEPYASPSSRPSYAKGQVATVWENAKDAQGRVYDPYTGEELFWDQTKSRAGQWDMGHLPDFKYSQLHAQYMAGEITWGEFLRIYKDPKNYIPQSVKSNRGHQFE